jgi:hypothetical protein
MSEQKTVAEMIAAGLDPTTGQPFRTGTVEAPVEPTKAVAKPVAKAPVAKAADPAQVTPQALTENILGGGSSAVEQLLTLLLAKEGRELAKMQQEEAAFKQREAKRALNNKDADSKILLRQARCRHLKGATSTAKNPTIDYAVYQHTFVSADTYIRCQICGMRWKPQDTVEYLVRNGRKIANHTKIGWREAYNMTRQSTNTATTSEIPFAAIYQAQQEGRLAVNPDAFGQEVKPQVVDLEGNVAHSVEI